MPRDTPGGDASAVTFDNPSANGKPHSGAFVFMPSVESLEGFKDLIQVFFIKSDPMILYVNFAVSGVASWTAGADSL